jgi:hypothetical protein
MKLNKHITISLVTVGLLFWVSSCTKDFEEINTNPNGPIKVPSVLLLPAMVENTMDLLYSTFNGGDMGSVWAQHWAKVQYNDEERYRPRATQFDAIWNSLYAGTIQDARVMYEFAESEKNDNLKAVALVMEVYAFSVLTDIFGDIPYSDALKAKEGITNPKYDSQSEIYAALLAKLDEANSLLTENGGSITGSSDILYGGNYMKWKRFANSLKFRMLMRMSNRSDFNKQAALQDIVSNRDIFQSNSDEAKLIYLAASPNNNPVNASIIAGNRGEYKVNSALVDIMKASDDPRLAVYAQLNAQGQYRGKPAGIIDVPNAEYDYKNVSAIGTAYLAATAPAYLMSYAELEFLIAEAAKRGLISGGDDKAAESYENGVRASMTANGVSVSAVDDYLDGRPYASNSALTLIHTEKWIALFGQGIEAWTEWRRTGIPALAPAIEGAINQIPSRYQYPPTEQALNPANYAAAVSAQGADLLTTKVWWNK